MLVVAAAVCAAANLAWHVLTRVSPDYQIAYVSAAPLSEEAENAWKERLAALGDDCNGDGRIVVQINQYLLLPDSENAIYNYASDVKLMADLDACESYFFLLADPEGFQAGYEVLREDWFPVEDGLYLARREFWEDRAPKYAEDWNALWEKIVEVG